MSPWIRGEGHFHISYETINPENNQQEKHPNGPLGPVTSSVTQMFPEHILAKS